MNSMAVTRREAGFAALVLFMGCSFGARADVRRREDPGGRPWLDVQLTQRGPWSPLAPIDESALNPWGDSLGDAQPGSSDAQDRLFASWVRPSDGLVLHAESRSATPWRFGRPVAATGAVGVPQPNAVGDGWGLAWQAIAASGDPVIDLAGVGADGESGTARRMLTGYLIDARFEDDIQYVTHQDGLNGGLFLSAILWAVPGVPSPIERLWTRDLSNSSGDPVAPGPADGQPGRPGGPARPTFGRDLGSPPDVVPPRERGGVVSEILWPPLASGEDRVGALGGAAGPAGEAPSRLQPVVVRLRSDRR